MVVMQHRLLAASLRPTPVQVPPTGADDLRNGLFSPVQLLLDKLARHALARYLIALFIGVVAAMGWESWEDSTGQAATSAGTSRDQQQLNATLLDSMRRRIDQTAVNVAALQEEMKSRDDRLGTVLEKLAASGEQTTRDITNLQDVFLRKMEPSSWPTLALVPIPVRRSQTPSEASARAGWRRQPCCQWPISSSR